MRIAILLNLIWIVWTLYKFFTGFGMYEGVHSHVYAYLFYAGLISILLGSILLKVLYVRNKQTSLVRVGFGFWLFGFLAFISCIFTGSSLPAVHILKAHVLFNHGNFLIYLLGIMISVYVDTLIVSRLDLTKKNTGKQ